MRYHVNTNIKKGVSCDIAHEYHTMDDGGERSIQ
jgi:hypothetical protein